MAKEQAPKEVVRASAKQKQTASTKEIVRLVDYSKNLDAAILQVEKDGIKLKHKIHNVALSIITAWGKGNIKDQEPADYFNKLAAAAGYHGKAVANWLEVFSTSGLGKDSVKLPIAFSDENDKWYVLPEAKVNGLTFTAARDNPFFEVSPPADPKPTDFAGMLYALLNKNSKAQTEDVLKKKAAAGITDKVIPVDVARKIREVLAQSGISEAE